MTASAKEIQAIRHFLEGKVLAEKQKIDVVRKVKEHRGEFVLLDARDRASWEAGHIPGALAAPLSEVEQLAATLSKDREYVTYCWNHT